MGRSLVVSFLPGTSWLPFALGGMCLLLIGGCGTSSWVGHQYNNFTAYYNKFYNANKAFEKGVKAFRDADRSFDRTRYVSVFLTPEDRSSESSFENAIQKSADVLREHPNSKWVDDALLLIGKSYFYQNNYVGAAQKFREVLAMEQVQSRQARFWLARTLVTDGSYSEAAEVLRVGDEETTPTGSWTPRMRLVRAELLVQQQQWAEADTALERGLTGDLPDGVAARGTFLLGQVRETLGAPTEARAAYRSVGAHDPSYSLQIAARLSEIELQGQHGNPSRALERLQETRQDDKNLEKQGEIAIVEARIYRAQGQYDRARDALKDMLYGDRDEVTLSGTAEGRLHYDLATLYRDAYKDFSRAAAHFDTASTGLQSVRFSREEEQRLPSAPLDAQSQADQYRNLAERAREVARMDSLLRVGRMSEQEFQAFVTTLRRRREAAQQARREARRQASRTQQFRSRRDDPTERGQGTPSAAQTQDSDAGFLFHKDPTRVQEGRRRFRQTWGDRPRVDNWRRRNAMQSIQASTQDSVGLSEETDVDVTSAQDEGRSVPGIDLSDIPRDSSSQAKMVADRAVARYELANSLFLAAGQPDSAATWYRRVLQENGDQPVARRALYALAEAYRAMGDSTAAQQTYERLVEQYSGSTLARRARERLGRGRQTSENDAALADSTYGRVYEQWQKGGWRPALDRFLGVAQQYPDTDAAPRALLAAGVIYWRRVQGNSPTPPRRPLERYLWSLQRSDSSRSSGASRLRAESPPANASPVDSEAGMRDSLQQISFPDSSGGASESSFSEFNVRRSIALLVDSTEWDVENWMRIGGDSTAADTTTAPYAPLTDLLTHLTERYPDAPQVKQAQSMLTLIEQRRAPADSVATDSVGEDQMPADSVLASTDSMSRRTQRKPVDSVRTSVSSSGQGEDSPPDTTLTNRAALPGPSSASTPPSDSAAAGVSWTLLVRQFPTSEEASAHATALQRRLGDEWELDVLSGTEAGRQRHLLVVGRFTTRQAASKARVELEKQLSQPLTVRSVTARGGE